ncbi:hypothetical protein D3C81_760670 [compost metagenome]
MRDTSDPCAPAFMYTAPPTVPGIPEANSIPVRPFLPAMMLRLTKLAPPSASTSVPRNSDPSSPLPNLITAPRIPRSDTSIFDPLPTSIQGTFSSCRIRIRCWSCCTVSGTITASAGPPIFHVVYLAIGSFGRILPTSASDNLEIHCCILISLPGSLPS